MESYAAPGKRLTIAVKGGFDKDRESTLLTILAGSIFIIGCSFYLVGAILNLPQLDASDAWMYNAIGAAAFILCGFVEYCNFMGGFHVFLIFAGIFGLIAEVLDGQQSPISVHFNFLANHMYFCEAVKVYNAHSGDFYFMEIANKYIMVETLKVADLFFVLGTMIDLGLAWIYLFFTGSSNGPGEGSSGEDHLNMLKSDDQKVAEVASASLWFVCAILTLIVYIRMAQVKASAGESDDDDEDEKESLTNLSSDV
ncbi:MAG: hypothetical protein SGBAC_004063 [Bacillariaceae sp.]